MEYPTFITAGTHALLGYWPFGGVRIPEEVTIHEFGHQYWQGLVANNEFEEAWLDEGVNSYSTGRIMEIGYGADAALIDLPGLRLSEVDSNRLKNNPNRLFDVIRQPAWKYASSGAYSFNWYAKPDLVLRALESIVGDQTMGRIMRTYHERWRYGHPSSDDFYAVASQVAGRDLRPLLVQLAETGALLDYEVQQASSHRRSRPAGYFEQAGGARELKSRKNDDDVDANSPYETTVTLRRRGELAVPVTVAFRFEGGRVERVVWDGQERWKRYELTRRERLESVEIDPDRRLALDIDWLNNARRVEPDSRGAAWLVSRWLLVVQQALSWVSL